MVPANGRPGGTATGAGAGEPADTFGGFLAVDSGGSGLRVAVGVPGGAPSAPLASGLPVRTGARGIDADHLMEQLTPMARALMADNGIARLSTAVVGAAGLATLGDALRADLPDALARAFGVRTLALAADAVTAYAGALGARPGAVVAAGTGLIATGTDLTRWRRADGWGHLLGDCGGGAWIGRAGLEAALRAHDGRDGGSPRLLAAVEEVFGPAGALPGKLYPRDDRAAVLASFAPRVAALAGDDPVADTVMRTAARHIAESAAAVCPPSGSGEAAQVALTGGLLRLGEALLGPLEAELARRLPHASRVTAEGDPLHGAVRIAADLSDGATHLPEDELLLRIIHT